MSAILTPEQEQEVACPIYFIQPDEEPELHMPQEEVRLEQPFLSEAGQAERSYASNTSTWD